MNQLVGQGTASRDAHPLDGSLSAIHGHLNGELRPRNHRCCSQKSDPMLGDIAQANPQNHTRVAGVECDHGGQAAQTVTLRSPNVIG